MAQVEQKVNETITLVESEASRLSVNFLFSKLSLGKNAA